MTYAELREYLEQTSSEIVTKDELDELRIKSKKLDTLKQSLESLVDIDHLSIDDIKDILDRI